MVALALSIHFFHCTFEGGPIGNGQFVVKEFLEYFEVLGDKLSELGSGDGIQMIHVTMEFFEARIGREDSEFTFDRISVIPKSSGDMMNL